MVYVVNIFAKGSGLALASALAVLVLLHVYWTLGGEWGLAAALGRDEVEPTPALRAGAAVIAVLLAVAVAGVLVRVGVWTLPLRPRLLSVGAWLLVGALVLVAVANATAATDAERFVFAPLALALAALAAVVALSDGPS